MAREITKVGVVGLGTMGAGIVEVFARSGYDVIGVDADEGAVDAGRQRVEGSTGRPIARLNALSRLLWRYSIAPLNTSILEGKWCSIAPRDNPAFSAMAVVVVWASAEAWLLAAEACRVTVSRRPCEVLSSSSPIPCSSDISSGSTSCSGS